MLKLLSILASQDNPQTVITSMREFKLQGVQHTPLWELVCMVEMALHHMSRNNFCPHMLFQDLYYGLEVTKLKTTEITKLENFQRKMLRQLQFLPDSPSPSNAAIYGLLGVKPVTASMDTAFSSPARKNCWQSR